MSDPTSAYLPAASTTILNGYVEIHSDTCPAKAFQLSWTMWRRANPLAPNLTICGGPAACVLRTPSIGSLRII
jgi:hypothetical protein